MSSLLLLSPLLKPASAMAISMPGVWEWLVIFMIVLVVFGPGKLPLIGEALGRSIKSFKKAVARDDEIDVTPHEQISEPRERTTAERTSTTEEQRTQVR